MDQPGAKGHLALPDSWWSSLVGATLLALGCATTGGHPEQAGPPPRSPATHEAIPRVTSTSQASAPPGFTRARSVVVRNDSACALLENGRIACWGNDEGQFGRGPPPGRLSSVTVKRPVLVPGVVAVEQSGDSTACARTAGGEVWCWGALGKLVEPETKPDWAITPRLIPGLSGVVEVDAIRYQVMTRHTDGSVRVWGQPLYVAHPGGSTLKKKDTVATPTVVPELTGALRIDLGDNGGCAVMPPERRLLCWGTEYLGEIWVTAPGPQWVPNLTNVRKAILGEHHRCALLEDGTVRCWGRNADGELGNGSTLESKVPVAVRNVKGAIDLAGQSTLSCAVLADGRVTCWGDDHFGLLGEPEAIYPIAREHPRMRDVRTLDVTAGMACGCLTNGEVGCWGEQGRETAALGREAAAAGAPEPQRAGTAPAVARLALGPNYSCALTSEGNVWCWGANDVGQAGANSSRDMLQPRRIDKLEKATQISAGYLHACARLANGQVLCWGRNGDGQLGAGPNAPQRSPVPLPVVGVTDAAEVSAAGFSCVRHNNGTVSCWGDYDPGNGDLHPLGSQVPVRVPQVSGARAIDVGGLYGCALDPSGALCWQRALYHPPGKAKDAWRRPASRVATAKNATDIEVRGSVCLLDARGCVTCPIRDIGRPRPAFEGLCGVTDLARGEALCCILGSTGEVTCAKDGEQPKKVTGLRASLLAVGENHACALSTNQRVVCWGSNDRGQLGNGTTQTALSPIEVKW